MPQAASIRIGTRASPLARWQAHWVAERLGALGHAVELVPITTQGDVNRRSPIGEIGTTGVFTKELQRALLDGRIDVAVHSLKDLPTDVVPGLALAAVPQRESPFDALVTREARSLADLPPRAKIGTGSLRRQAQLLHARPDLQVSAIRGNVETRLQKLADGEFDAIVLAEAGLNRLGLADRIAQRLLPPAFLPAVGQGALGIETRDSDEFRQLVAALDDAMSHAAVIAERAFLAAMQGGCTAPLGAWGRLASADELILDGVALSIDGQSRIVDASVGPTAEPAALGERLAAQLLASGAGGLYIPARGI